MNTTVECQNAQRDRSRLGWSLLLLVMLGFLTLRLPAMFLQAGGQDEEYYAIPGLTILENGVPRLPHAPARNPESVYIFGEQCLFSEPPLYFYLQAFFYAILPDCYGTARLASAIAGCGLLASMYVIACRLKVSLAAAIFSISLFSFSRWYFFSAIAARPDMLCAMFGLAAVVFAFRWTETKTSFNLIVTGGLIGLGGLTHMYAIAYAIPIGIWIIVSARGRQRLMAPAIVTGIAIAMLLLWLPLILSYPDIFRQQFITQVFHGTGGSMLGRIAWPWRSISYHVHMLWGHLGAWQFLLAISGWTACGWWGWKNQDRSLRTIWWLTTASFWLICALVGPHHPVFGYWTFSSAMMFVGIGIIIDRMLAGFSDRARKTMAAKLAVAVCLFVSFIPGSGIRTFSTHVAHFGDVNYNAPRFANELISQLPAQARFAVDTQFALDFLVAGRNTLIAETFPLYFRVDQFPIDYLIVSRHGMDTKIVDSFDVELLWTRGVRDDLLACYVEVYRVKSSPTLELKTRADDGL